MPRTPLARCEFTPSFVSVRYEDTGSAVVAMVTSTWDEIALESLIDVACRTSEVNDMPSKESVGYFVSESDGLGETPKAGSCTAVPTALACHSVEYIDAVPLDGRPCGRT